MKMDKEVDSLRRKVFCLNVVLLSVIIILCGVLSEIIKVKQAIMAKEAQF